MGKNKPFSLKKKKPTVFKKVEMNSVPHTNADNIEIVQLEYIASVLPIFKLNISKNLLKTGLGITTRV